MCWSGWPNVADIVQLVTTATPDVGVRTPGAPLTFAGIRSRLDVRPCRILSWRAVPANDFAPRIEPLLLAVLPRVASSRPAVADLRDRMVCRAGWLAGTARRR